MGNQVFECQHCDAPLPETKGLTEVRCTYCNTVNRLQAQQPPQPRSRPPVPQPTSPPSKSSSGKSRRGKALLIILIIAIGIGGAIYFYDPFHVWDGITGPVHMDINGRTMMIGRVRLVRDDDQLFVQGTWADTGERAWRYGPLGSYSVGAHTVRYALSAGSLALSGPRSELRILDPATGQERFGMQLSDAVEHICLTGEPSQVVVETVDHRRALLNLTVGQLTEYTGKPFKPCLQMATGTRVADRGEASLEPQLDGFRLMRTWRDGQSGVAVLKKDPGTPHPIVAGFAPGSGQVIWQAPLSLADPVSVKDPGMNDYPGDISATRFVVAYAVGSEERRLACFDTRNGARLWDVALKELFAVDRIDRVVASARYGFIERTSSLDIYDLTNGELIDTVGDDTYE